MHQNTTSDNFSVKHRLESGSTAFLAQQSGHVFYTLTIRNAMRPHDRNDVFIEDNSGQWAALRQEKHSKHPRQGKCWCSIPRLMLLALGEGSPPEQWKLKSFHGLHNLCSLHITPASSLALTCTMSSVLLVDLFWFLVILRLPLRRAPFAGFSACCCCNCTSAQRGAPLKSQMVDQKKQIFSGQLSRTPLSSRNNQE